MQNLPPSHEEGFSLVETMVVVAIVGLLAAVVIPNFKQYQAKSKIAEARLHLAAVYTAQSVFFSDFKIYHGCIDSMNYNSSSEKPSRYYTVGFHLPTLVVDPVAHQVAVVEGLDSVKCPVSVTGADGVSYFTGGKGVGSSISDLSHLPTTTALGSQDSEANKFFIVGAAGVVHADYDSATTSSAMTIDQTKAITVVRNGF